MIERPRIAVVIPCYKVKDYILNVIGAIGPEVERIYVVDDCCPQNSGEVVARLCVDGRVRVIRHHKNMGVGGAVMSGYQAAIDDGMGVIVKIDGDGQMDPALIPAFVSPIIDGEADYTKGNRFFDLETVRAMPRLRLFGNAVLSLMTKVSSGYWNLFDPTNGYTAINADVAQHLPLEKISKRYFFETDMLFRLYTLRAVVLDIPMDAKYADEISNLKISRIVGEFFFKHIRNFSKRLFYSYYLRDMSLASLQLPIGIVLLIFGFIFGCYHWVESVVQEVATPTGTIVLAALAILMGGQFIFAFLGHDIAAVPTQPIHRRLRLRSVRLKK